MCGGGGGGMGWGLGRLGAIACLRMEKRPQDVTMGEYFNGNSDRPMFYIS